MKNLLIRAGLVAVILGASTETFGDPWNTQAGTLLALGGCVLLILGACKT